MAILTMDSSKRMTAMRVRGGESRAEEVEERREGRERQEGRECARKGR